MQNYKEQLKHITTLIFDVDGVFTDSSVLLLPDGEQVRIMSSKDGYAVQLAVKKGIRIAVISGGRSEAVRMRMNGLGVQDVFLHASNKVIIFKEYSQKHQLSPDEILYMGDDIPDYQVMKHVGLPTCPKDAAPEIREISRYISHKNGGEGCVRDIIEQVLRAQDKWFDDDSNEW